MPEFLGPNALGPNIILDFFVTIDPKGLWAQFLEHKFFLTSILFIQHVNEIKQNPNHYEAKV